MILKREPYRGKVIVVNDAPSVSGRLTKWLTQNGYQYTFVDSVEEANELLEHVEFDGIVCGREFLFSRSAFQ